MRTSVAGVLCLLVLSTMSVPAQSPVAQLADAGWRAIDRDDAERAAAAFREALSIRPSDPVLNLGAGVAAHMQGRDRDASLLLQKAVRLDPGLTPASKLLGEIAYREGDLELAINTYEAALAHAPRNLAMKQRLDAWRNEAASFGNVDAIKNDRFVITFEGPADQRLAARATAVLGSAFWRIGNAIGSYPSDPINVNLDTRQQFRDVTGASEWAGGGFDGQIRLPVRGAMEHPDAFDRALTHELAHAMLKSVAPNLPAWLNEGLAMRFEGSDVRASERVLASSRMYVPLSELQTSFSGLTGPQASAAYAESLFAVTALLDRIGTPGLAQLLQETDARSIDTAVQRFGFTMADFEAKLARRMSGPAAAVP